MSPGPITPQEVDNGSRIPEEVFEAFNELIQERKGYFSQDDVIDRILTKMIQATRAEIFRKGWLDVEPAYRAKGWKVSYDKPGYNESYEASFSFVEA